MGLLDSFDYDALLKKLLEGQAQPNSRAPFNQGLMAMGAQMLANSNRDFGSALGAGGLGYLEASNAERARQQKDPMQQINMATAVMGLREKAENAKAMADWQRQLSGAPQNAPMAPQSDFAPGEAQGPVTPPMQAPMMPQGAAMGGFSSGATTSPLAPQPNIPSLQIVQAGMNSPSAAVRTWAKSIWETNYKPYELPVGAKRYQGDQVVATNPNLDKGMRLTPGGMVEPEPGYPQAAATIASAVKGAEARATAEVADQYAPPATLTSKGGGTETVSPATARLAVRWDIPAPMAREITTQFPQEQWDSAAAALKQVGGRGSGGAANFNPQTGAVESVRPGGSGGAGYGTLSAADAARAMTPVEVERAEALTGPKIREGAQSGANEDFVKNEYRPVMTKAANAKQTLVGLDVIDKTNPKTGWGAPVKLYAARVLEGIGMAPDAAKQFAVDGITFNQVLNTEMWRLLGEQKGPQTEQDAKRAQLTFANLENTPEANKFITAMHRAMHNQSVEKGKFYADNFEAATKKGDQFTLESAWQKQQKSLWDDPALAPYKEGKQADSPGSAPKAQRVPQDSPVLKGAKQAPDGKWYIKIGGKWNEVVQ